MLSVRIIRSSSCTIRIEKLGLEVDPGGATTGYVSNVEGVLNRFEGAIQLMYRQSISLQEQDIIDKCESLLEKINLVKSGDMALEIIQSGYILDLKGTLLRSNRENWFKIWDLGRVSE